MSGDASTFYTARFLLPYYLVRAADNVLTCNVYRDGAQISATSGTCTVYDSTGEQVATGATSTGTSPAYTLAAASVPDTLNLGNDWRVEFDLVIAGADYRFKNKAHLVRSHLHPVITDVDLYRRQKQLDPSGAGPLTSDTDMQDYIDEAWVVLLGRIQHNGPLPFLIMEPTALREVHINLALSLVFEGAQVGLTDAGYDELADKYRGRYEDAYRALTFEYDSGLTGRVDGSRRRAASSQLWLA